MSNQPGAAFRMVIQRPGNYAEQAKTYDRTRGASPTIVRTIACHLGSPDGRLLLDIAGGTGNYAQVFQGLGFRLVVVDAELEMVRRAAGKLGPARCVVADAAQLPFKDRSCDCAMLVNALHVLDDPGAAFREALRVLRGGPLILTAFTKENLSPLFVHRYFGLESLPAFHPTAGELEDLLREAGFSEVRRERFVYTDTVDGSLSALHTDALHLAGPAYLRNTSFWHRLGEHARRQGLSALAADLRSGVLARRVQESFQMAATVGHGTVFAAWP